VAAKEIYDDCLLPQSQAWLWVKYQSVPRIMFKSGNQRTKTCWSQHIDKKSKVAGTVPKLD